MWDVYIVWVWYAAKILRGLGSLIVVALVCCSVFSLGCASVGCKSSNVTCV